MYEGFTLAENMTEIKSAFDTAIPVLFDEMYDVDDVKPTITKEIIAESKDGACTLRINIDSSLSLVRDGVDMAMFINMHTVISAKDGKIVDFTMDLDTEQKAVQGDNILQKFTQKAIHALTVEYKFAKDKYDALEGIKVQLKDYLSANGLSELSAEDEEDGMPVTSKVVLQIQNRKSLDELAMERDGIDLNKYKVTKQINVLKLKE